jgi:hypothetical protein
VSAENVSKYDGEFDLNDLRFRDPNNFLPGNLHSCIHEWEKIDAPEIILNWLKGGIDVNSFLDHLKVTLRVRVTIRASHLQLIFPIPLLVQNLKSLL